jgi:hypothetical protein
LGGAAPGPNREVPGLAEPQVLGRCRLVMKLLRTAIMRTSTKSRVWLATGLLITGSGCVSAVPVESSNPSNGIALLPCQDVIASSSAPPSDFSIVLDRVALPTGRALQTNRGSSATDWLFAKEGLLIRRGTAFDLVVPDDWRSRLNIGWGSPAKRTSHLRVSGCRPTKTVNPIRASDEWLAYPGGYWVSEPACVAVLVRAGQAEQTVRIGVGAACPGQSPPPPSDGS